MDGIAELLPSLRSVYQTTWGEWASPPPRRESKPIVGSVLWSKMVLGTRTIPKIPSEGIQYQHTSRYMLFCCDLRVWILWFCNDAGQSQPHGLKWDGRAWHCGIMRPRDLSSAGIRRICEYQQVHWSGNVEHNKIHMNQFCCFRHLVIFVDYAAWCWV